MALSKVIFHEVRHEFKRKVSGRFTCFNQNSNI